MSTIAQAVHDGHRTYQDRPIPKWVHDLAKDTP